MTPQLNTDPLLPIYALIEDPPVTPLSLRLAAARQQFGAMFQAGELATLPDDTRAELRGLELFLFAAHMEVWELETAAAMHRAERRMPRWMRWGRLG